MKKINNLFSYSKKPIKERQNKSKSGRKKENNTDKSRSQWNWNNRTTEKKKSMKQIADKIERRSPNHQYQAWNKEYYYVSYTHLKDNK